MIYYLLDLNMAPIISVIIPTYNRKDILKEALRSVFIQQPFNYEVVIVDDGSTDKTVESLKSLSFSMTIIQAKHGGAAASINIGIQKAKGKYVAFLDSDDLWMRGILLAQLQYLQHHPNTPLVYTDQYVETSGKRAPHTRFQMVNLSNVEKIYFKFPSFVQFVPIQISSVMINKSIFDEIGYFDETLAVHYDSEMWNRICEKYKLGYISAALSIRRYGRDSEGLTKGDNRNLYCEDGLKYLKIYEKRRRNSLTNREKRAIQESYRRIKVVQHTLTPLHFHLQEFR